MRRQDPDHTIIGRLRNTDIVADFSRQYNAQLKLVKPEKSPGVRVTQVDSEIVRDGAVVSALTALATFVNENVPKNWADADKTSLLLRVIQKVFAFNFLTQLEDVLPGAVYTVLGRAAPEGSPLHIEDTKENNVFSAIAMLLVHVEGLETSLGITMGPLGDFVIRRGGGEVDFLVNDAQRAAPHIKELLSGDVLVYRSCGLTKEFDVSLFSDSSESAVMDQLVEDLNRCVEVAQQETVAGLKHLTGYLRRHESDLLVMVEGELGSVAAATTAAVNVMRAAPGRPLPGSRTGTVLGYAAMFASGDGSKPAGRSATPPPM